MNELTLQVTAIPPMSLSEIDNVRQFETMVLKLPQVDISTRHLLHAGMYARSIMLPAGTVLTGALIKRATILILNGSVRAYIGSESLELEGYNVLPASSNRKQAFYAITDTYMTMLFPTKAKTVREAEEEFTDEADRLLSRNTKNNHITITGEE